MWLLILYYYTILCFYFTFFSLLRSPRDKFYNLERLIRFNYSPPPIIISIFQPKSFHLFNWIVSQLKSISLIKLTSTLNTLFLLERNFFSLGKWLKGMTKTVHKKCIKGEQKSAQKVLLLYWYLCLWLLFCFISLLFDYQWNWRISSSLKPFFKFFLFLFCFIKTN